MGDLKKNSLDKFSREFQSLRISLTQACNFQCVYCVSKGLVLKKLAKELLAQELFFLAQQIIQCAGIKKIRLTGGEPLLYQGIEEFLRATREINIEKSITTNGVLLEKNLQLLWQCGYHRINISLDALQQGVFQELTRRKGLAKVLSAVERARQLGFALKINVVLMKSLNEHQILPLLDFCLQRNIECRYIELMQMGHINKTLFDRYFLSMPEILKTIASKYNFNRVLTDPSATAQKFAIPKKGFFGIIPNYSAPFCKNCNRLRITSDGKLYGCISSTKHQSLIYLLELSKEKIQKELEKILPLAMKSKQNFFVGSSTFMQQIGG